MNEETNGPEAPTSEKPPLREEELRQILEAHRKWVESEKKQGKRANLRDANLRGANLYRANLQRAIFIRANLQGIHLYRANLRGANLRDAKLQGARLIESDVSGADLTKANLQKAELAGVKGLAEATLQNANLEDATGLLGTEFARADVTGAKLPEGIREFKLLETVTETSKNARKIFFWMLLGCAYSWLTIATTTDARLLTINSPTWPLPIIGTEVPIAWFYWAAPFYLVMVYVYLHFYLRMLWEGLAGLPAKFPDGKRLDQRAYPWLLNGLVRRHFKRLREDRPSLIRLEEWTTIFLAWWAVPATLFGFWLRYLRRHEWWGTAFHVGVVVAAVAIGIILYRSAARTLRGTHPPLLGWKTFWRDRRTYQVAGTALLGVLLSVLSFGAIEGIGKRFRGDNPGRADFASTKHFVKKWVPRALEKIGYSPFADLVEAEVSIKPENWRGFGDEEQLEAQIAQVKGARLSGVDLRYASADGAFLIKADLDEADLRMASLVRANLQQANLSAAKLQGAMLSLANLQGATLQRANLQGATLNLADLQRTTLGDANLQQANLLLVNLQGADLAHANLRGANLGGGNLQGANLRGANLQATHLGLGSRRGPVYIRVSPLSNEVSITESGDRADVTIFQPSDVRDMIQISDWRFANLQGANLEDANLREATLNLADLQGADLGGADLQGANLKGAKLQGADLDEASLQGADLRETEGLTQEQLYGACGDAETKLPPGMAIKPCVQLMLKEKK